MRALVRNLPNVSGPLSQMVICSINVGSSTGAFELLTRFDTVQRCKTLLATGLSSSVPPTSSQEAKSLGPKDHRHSIVYFGGDVVWFGDDHCAGLQSLTGGTVFPFVPEPGERHRLAV